MILTSIIIINIIISIVQVLADEFIIWPDLERKSFKNLKHLCFSKSHETIFIQSCQNFCRQGVYRKVILSLNGLKKWIRHVVEIQSRSNRYLRKGASVSIVHLVKHANFQLYRAFPDGFIWKKLIFDGKYINKWIQHLYIKRCVSAKVRVKKEVFHHWFIQ